MLRKPLGPLILAFLLVLPILGAAQRIPLRDDSTLRLAVDLVLLDVAVEDRDGRVVTDLRHQDFKVYEDEIEQSISTTSTEETPVSWGLVLDASGSMKGMMQDVYNAAMHVIDEGSKSDEMFIMTFSDRIYMVSEFSSDRHILQTSLRGLEAQGATAMRDAVASAIDRIRLGKHRKKVLLVVTDGMDNRSRWNRRSLLEKVQESDILIYTVGILGSMTTLEMMHQGNAARSELEALAERTGGKAHFPRTMEQCRDTMNRIAMDVSQHYTIGYYPTNEARDGRWRKVKVAVVKEGNKKERYIARTRRGYYAPRED